VVARPPGSIARPGKQKPGRGEASRLGNGFPEALLVGGDLLLDDRFRDLAGGDERADAALREVLADGAHALADAGAVRVVLAAVGVVVGGAGHLDGEAGGAGLAGDGDGAEGDSGCEGGAGCEDGGDRGHWLSPLAGLMERLCPACPRPAVPGGTPGRKTEKSVGHGAAGCGPGALTKLAWKLRKCSAGRRR